MERERQIAVINTFYFETINKDVPQVSRYTHGDVPNAILTKQYVIVCQVSVLPDFSTDSYENWLHSDYIPWYNNFTAVGDIRFVRISKTKQSIISFSLVRVGKCLGDFLVTMVISLFFHCRRILAPYQL